MKRPQLRDADALEVLLDQYAATRLAPDPEHLARGRVPVLTTFVRASAMPARARRRYLLRGWSLSAAFALLVIGGSGLVAAESGPGQPFYGLRLAIGSVTLPVEEPAHDRGLAAQLDDRLNEAGDAAQIGDGRGAGVAISEYLRTLSELTRNGVTDPAILAVLQRHQDTLQQLLSVAPAQAADGVQKALDAASNVGVGVQHPTPPQGARPSPPATGKP
jgi:hypothetical protein